MEYVLGLDLGTSSLGWSIIGLQPVKADGWCPASVVRAGVRIFEAGVEGDVEQGRDSSRAAVRRQARQPRRQNWRTQFRKRKLFQLLQSINLLPPSDSDRAEDRKCTLDELDVQLSATYLTQGDHAAHQQLPYLLRAKGLRETLQPFELGRALYSLSQRRGFLSNRKAQGDENDDGKVKSGISELARELAGRTLAEFFVQEITPVHADPSRQRMRQRYTARDMFRDEFDRIMDCQQAAFPKLKSEHWKQIKDAIFFQRPLKSQRHRIGKCEVDGKRRRCVDAIDVYQQFRIWQTVQNLRINDAAMLGRTPELSFDEQARLVEALQTVPLMTWPRVHKLLGFKRTAFSIQEWQPKGVIGHRTNAEMTKAFGDSWLEKSVAERNSITREVLYFRKDGPLKQRATSVWGLSVEQADELANVRLEETHARHSEQTLHQFVDGMKKGRAYSEIRKALTGHDELQVVEQLPPITNTGLDITNPAVIRALTEVRKVVNELVREYGKPAFVRIEMARELKNSRKRRQEMHNNNEDRRKRREKAIAGILTSIPGLKYSGADVEKWLLAEECSWACPYTGRSISPTSLLGSTPEFDVEHIYPRRYLDNGFGNKTLCHHDFNRNRKKNLTAYDACHTLPEWPEILERVKRFTGPVASGKLKRFQTSAAQIGDDFTERHLNDTRYNAVVAKKYLERLYGGTSDADGVQRVFAVTGGHTYELRRQWQLDAVLSDTDEKTRDDHRHHAIDAIVIALTDSSRVQILQRAAEFARERDSKRFYEAVQEPWVGFIPEVQKAVEEITVSHRVTRTLSGALHAESIYSKEHTDQSGQSQHRIRKAIGKLSATELQKDRIVDPMIRKLIVQKLEELGESNPAKAFADPANHPYITTKDGQRKIPIHKVRVTADKKPRSIGKGPRQRFVASGKDSNFASMIYAVLDRDGKEIKWEHNVITRLEAHERLNAYRKEKGERVLRPSPGDFNDGKQRIYKFALCKNDMVLLEGPEGTDVLYRVQSLGDSEIQLCPHHLPGLRGKDRSQFDRITSIDSLRKRRGRRVVVTAIGNTSD